jgi:hypothetical protein
MLPAVRVDGRSVMSVRAGSNAPGTMCSWSDALKEGTCSDSPFAGSVTLTASS